MERLRQRSDWFLSPTVRERNNSRKGQSEGVGLSLFVSKSSCNQHHHRERNASDGGGNSGGNNIHHKNGSNKVLQQKNSGNSVVTKASSEGAVLDAFSDGDSVFTDTTSRSESPASEPVWSHILKVNSRDIIHSDGGTIAELSLPTETFYACGSGADISIDSHELAMGADASSTAFFSPISNIGLPGSLDNSNDYHRVGELDVRKERSAESEEDNTTPTEVPEEEDTSTLVTGSMQSGHSGGEPDSVRDSLMGDPDSVRDLDSMKDLDSVKDLEGVEGAIDSAGESAGGGDSRRESVSSNKERDSCVLTVTSGDGSFERKDVGDGGKPAVAVGDSGSHSSTEESRALARSSVSS